MTTLFSVIFMLWAVAIILLWFSFAMAAEEQRGKAENASFVTRNALACFLSVPPTLIVVYCVCVLSFGCSALRLDIDPAITRPIAEFWFKTWFAMFCVSIAMTTSYLIALVFCAVTRRIWHSVMSSLASFVWAIACYVYVLAAPSV